jgi:DNA-binding protein HU-beta
LAYFAEQISQKRVCSLNISKGVLMTKKEFVALAAEKAGLINKDTEAALDAILVQIAEYLSKGEDVSFIGFGTFKVVKRPERMGRNPGTGQAIKIPATSAVIFKVGARLKEAVSGKKA